VLEVAIDISIPFSSTMVIFPCLSPAVAQVIEIDFGKIHVCSSLTIVIFVYVAPAFAQVVEVAFGKIHVCSSLTIVIILYVAPKVEHVVAIAFGIMYVWFESHYFHISSFNLYDFPHVTCVTVCILIIN